MAYCHKHNLVHPQRADAERKFGIRVRLPAGDTFAKVLGAEWERVHWYVSERERDLAFDNMATRHGYYRQTDSPTQILDKIVR
jgi:hypothetical protein